MDSQDMRRIAIIITLFALTGILAAAPLSAADHWVPPLDPAVVTNNDCGFVSAVAGSPQVRRSFHSEGDGGAEVYAADRIHSGDELSVPPGSRLEWISGNNIVVVLGENGQVRLGGLRSFADAEGRTVTRLDATLVRGEMRVQVRRNEDAPFAVLVTMNGVEVLVTRGDVEAYSNGGWHSAALAGDAAARIRRGGVAGAPFTFAEGTRIGATGQDGLGNGEAAAIKARLPFSFEQVRAALPPVPAMNSELEAP